MFQPELPLLRETELVFRTYMSGTEISMQQLQKDGTFRQGVQIQNRQSDK